MTVFIWLIMKTPFTRQQLSVIIYTNPITILAEAISLPTLQPIVALLTQIRYGMLNLLKMQDIKGILA